MKKIWTGCLAAAAVIIICGIGLYYYDQLSSEISSKDIIVSGTMQKVAKDKYLVDLQITRTKEEKNHNFIYPVIQGLGNVSFIEGNALFEPSSIGTDYGSQKLLDQVIKTAGAEHEQIGFSIPGELGIYEMKFTMQRLEDVTKLNDPSIYYVHKENMLGKKLSWISKTSIQIN